ncbi:hypothetical protein [Antrihabitans sp. YC2-6]|uniref:hypothetical protein n=1 Tax=Antrihabitans sp. YC2-6 TaxID=2799498 RepID=UPI001F391C64|nr:hypothetical protein [Antrihabitans sp. YC2-6]
MTETFPNADDADRAEQSILIDDDVPTVVVDHKWDADDADLLEQAVPVPISHDEYPSG